MNLTSTPGLSPSAAASQDPTAQAAQILVLKKAMNLQATNAATLIESLPPAPALASSGTLGTKVNTYA